MTEIINIRDITTKFNVCHQNNIKLSCHFCKNKNSANYYNNGDLFLCRFCYISSSLNYGFLNEIEIYYSKLSQLEIIKKTRDYYILHSSMPKPLDIDINIKKSDITIIEFIYLLKDNVNFDKSNYKIFYNDNFKINFDILVYQCIMYNSDDELETLQKIKKNIPLIKTKNIGIYTNYFKK